MILGRERALGREMLLLMNVLCRKRKQKYGNWWEGVGGWREFVGN